MADKKNQGPKIAEPRLSMFQEYLYVYLLFWVFISVVAFISFFTCGGVWDDVTSGIMEFLFVIVGGGFTVVAVIDYFYEKQMGQTRPEGQR